MTTNILQIRTDNKEKGRKAKSAGKTESDHWSHYLSDSCNMNWEWFNYCAEVECPGPDTNDFKDVKALEKNAWDQPAVAKAPWAAATS